MSLQEKLDAFKRDFESGTPAFNIPGEVIDTGRGAYAPDFALPDHLRGPFDSLAVRARGELVISYYRGLW